MGPRGARARVERRGEVVIEGALLTAAAFLRLVFGTSSGIGVIGVLERVWRWWFSGVCHILDGLVGLLDSVGLFGVPTLGGGT